MVPTNNPASSPNAAVPSLSCTGWAIRLLSSSAARSANVNATIESAERPSASRFRDPLRDNLGLPDPGSAAGGGGCRMQRAGPRVCVTQSTMQNRIYRMRRLAAAACCRSGPGSR